MGIARRVVPGLATVVVAGLIVGCGDAARGPTGPSPSASPLLDASANSASTMTINDQVPFSSVVFVSCANGGAGEPVAISGTLHVLIHITESSTGNFQVKQHFQPQGIGGVGLVTGDQYRGTGGTQTHFHDNASFPIVETDVNNFRIIGQGPDNNFLVHDNFHVTVNANGEVTVVHDNFSAECK